MMVILSRFDGHKHTDLETIEGSYIHIWQGHCNIFPSGTDVYIVIRGRARTIVVTDHAVHVTLSSTAKYKVVRSTLAVTAQSASEITTTGGAA